MEKQAIHNPTNHAFNDDDRSAVYRTILSRRDVRGQFLDKEISNDVLSRLLTAAHYAPSVGFMQPWNFIVVRSKETKKGIKALFDKAHQEAAEMFEGEKRDVYRKLKLEGIVEAPINICITCDRDRGGPVVIGKTHIPEMDLYSTVCSVQNLWLAARAEGIGLGWVSILDEMSLRKELSIPENVVPVAYLCLGYVSHFHDKPELEKAGWRPRLQLDQITNFDQWGGKPEGSNDKELLNLLRACQESAQIGLFVEKNLR